MKPSQMTKEQLTAILNANSEGQKWSPHFDGQNKEGVAVASFFSNSDMRSGYFSARMAQKPEQLCYGQSITLR